MPTHNCCVMYRHLKIESRRLWTFCLMGNYMLVKFRIVSLSPNWENSNSAVSLFSDRVYRFFLWSHLLTYSHFTNWVSYITNLVSSYSLCSVNEVRFNSSAYVRIETVGLKREFRALFNPTVLIYWGRYVYLIGEANNQVL